MTKIEVRLRDYKFFPYERRLASDEVAVLSRLAESQPKSLRSKQQMDQLAIAASRLTYASEVRIANGSSNKVVIPQQAMLEGSAANGNGPNGSVGRQSTRYSAHGLHEYRGKFNPQVVRAVANLLGLSQGQCLLDPFCGSGTSLLEAAHMGLNAIGFDRNPLAIRIANAKIACLTAPIGSIRSSFDHLRERIVQAEAGRSFDVPWTDREIEAFAGRSWQDRLEHLEYLLQWFPKSVLGQLSFIMGVISELRGAPMREIYRIALSDILRDVSYQDPGDLRIRRRTIEGDNCPVLSLYLTSLEAKVKRVLAARALLPQSDAVQRAILTDTCELDARKFTLPRAGFDAAITSPPYATALPYIDTQRLSLVFLGEIPPEQIMSTEKALIGTREIDRKRRQIAEAQIRSNEAVLPHKSIGLVRELASAFDPKTDGFRRQNVPALVYNYLISMRQAIAQVHKLLRKDGHLAIVIGVNRTQLGGRDIVIETPALLADVAEAVGFDVVELRELDTYPRYGIHMLNSIQSESLLVVRPRCNSASSAKSNCLAPPTREWATS